MGNVNFSIEYSIDSIGFILNQVNMAIEEVYELGFRHEEIKISMPTYFKEMLVEYNRREFNNFITSDHMLFGCKIVPAYENKIVIFHEDMPKLNDKIYKVIPLIVSTEKSKKLGGYSIKFDTLEDNEKHFYTGTISTEE